MHNTRHKTESINTTKRTSNPEEQTMNRKTHTALLGLITLALAAISTSASTFTTITIDGSFADWAGVPAIHADPLDNATGVDFNQIFMANDDNYLYVRFTLHAAANPYTFQTDFFWDGDNNASTGFDVFTAGFLGSEMLIEGASAYQEANGGFNEGVLAAGTVIQSPFNVAATDFEWRIDRSVVGVAAPFIGVPLISGETIQLFATTSTGTSDSVGDANTSVSYTFAVPEPGSLAIILVGGAMLGATLRRGNPHRR